MCKLYLLYCFILMILNDIHSQEAKCGHFEWTCGNGECIASDVLCDGIVDCKDGSDEIADSCASFQCPSFTFRCAYGACISKSAECNGIQNCADNSDETSGKCTNIFDRTFEKCSSKSMMCESGLCIPMEYSCDGNIDCDDGTDETEKLCALNICPPYSFRCKYGACISADAKCNGVKDCADGSDETLCGRVIDNDLVFNITEGVMHSNHMGKNKVNIIPDIHEECVLDSLPDVNVVYYNNTDIVVKPGEKVNNTSKIEYSCQQKYYLIGPSTNICVNGKWENEHPMCNITTRVYCNNSVVTGPTTEATCQYQDSRTSCNDAESPIGTVATISCRYGYQKQSGNLPEMFVCGKDGEWDQPPFSCEQVCGMDTTLSSLIDNVDEKDSRTIVPWHVSIYTELMGEVEQICSGTIINAKVVLSAAHCFWNIEENRVANISDFLVAAGKHYRNHSADEVLTPQYFKISELSIPPEYMDVESAYGSDIAVLVLDKFIDFKPHIKPICIDWQSSNNKSIESNLTGRVASWGKTDTFQSGDELKMVDLLTVSYEQCVQKVKEVYQPLVTGEKFCTRSGESICEADGGAGLGLPKNIEGTTRYFLQGIISFGLTLRAGCPGNHLVTITDIQFHEAMIMDLAVRYNPGYEQNLRTKVSTEVPKVCVLDSQTDVIVAYFDDQSTFVKPGESVNSSTTIAYTCQPKYNLTGLSTNLCFDGKWTSEHPTCNINADVYCNNSFINGATIEATCELYGYLISCNDTQSLAGTTATISCRYGYQNPSDNIQQMLVCGEDGEWDQVPFSCEQICGMDTALSSRLPNGDGKDNRTLDPWHVGIYSKLIKRNEQICGGTIINAKVVLSAAHCFWDIKENRAADKSHFAIAAGKRYRSYSAKEDLTPQFFEISELVIPPNYEDVDLSFVNDIAVIILDKFITFQPHIKPICIDWQSFKYKPIDSNLLGRVANWGKTNTFKSSQELKLSYLLTISHNQCLQEVENIYQRLVTADKFCTRSGDSICEADGGAGFVIPKNLNGTTIHLLQGIISFGLTLRPGCPGNHFVTVTDITFHQKMIEELESQYRPQY